LSHTAAPMMLFLMKDWSGCRSRFYNAVVLVVLYGETSEGWGGEDASAGSMTSSTLGTLWGR